jgi:hypothetical protein
MLKDSSYVQLLDKTFGIVYTSIKGEKNVGNQSKR